MKAKVVIFVLSFALPNQVKSQSESNQYRNFPIIIKLQFHNLAMPFKDLKSNFSNIGIGLGTEISYNGKSNWVHQLSATWHTNKTVGNGILIYSQAVWRPNIASGFYGELKVGAGYKYSFKPTHSFKQDNDGTWQEVGHKGKGMLALPLGISVGYQSPAAKTYISPFVSYQFLLLSGYNKSIPVLPETLVQIGSRIHLSR